MGEVVNLNKARKVRVRDEARIAAAANRAVHGIAKAEKAKSRLEREKAAKKLEQSRREPPPS